MFVLRVYFRLLWFLLVRVDMGSIWEGRFIFFWFFRILGILMWVVMELDLFLIVVKWSFLLFRSILLFGFRVLRNLGCGIGIVCGLFELLVLMRVYFVWNLSFSVLFFICLYWILGFCRLVIIVIGLFCCCLILCKVFNIFLWVFWLLWLKLRWKILIFIWKSWLSIDGEWLVGLMVVMIFEWWFLCKILFFWFCVCGDNVLVNLVL